jgi:hypothetical protein
MRVFDGIEMLDAPWYRQKITDGSSVGVVKYVVSQRVSLGDPEKFAGRTSRVGGRHHGQLCIHGIPSIKTNKQNSEAIWNMYHDIYWIVLTQCSASAP